MGEASSGKWSWKGQVDLGISSGELIVRNKKWQVKLASGEWPVGSGKQGVASGMGHGEWDQWRVVSGEWENG